MTVLELILFSICSSVICFQARATMSDIALWAGRVFICGAEDSRAQSVRNGFQCAWRSIMPG
jgi:hypothetical protein